MSQKAFHAKHGLTVNGTVTVNGTSGNVSLHVNSSDAIRLPSGNTAQRPTPADGYFRYNTQTSNYECVVNGQWINAIADVAAIQSSINAKYDKTGGTINGGVTVNGNLILAQSNTQSLKIVDVGTENANNAGLRIIQYGSSHASFPGLIVLQNHKNDAVVSQFQMYANGFVNIISADTVAINGAKIWHAGNMGPGSGLNADKWQGANYTVSTAAPTGGADGDFWFQRDA